MIDILSEKLARKLFEYNTNSKTSLEVYKYGLDLIISSIFNIAILLIIASVWGVQKEVILYTMCFAALRVTSGGYHWVKMNNYSYSTSKKFRVATKSAFIAVLEAWKVEKVYLPSTLVTRAAAAFGTYYFLTTDEENVYYFKEYHYRELGAGFFDSLGNFIGDYQIRKTERTTLNSNGTGGQTYIKYEYSSIVTPTI